jgi:NDP-sugar pyrophosphorylase family protein
MKAVVLAGGKGTRLSPYTKILPKPLMPIGDMPILEVILRQMKGAGIDRVILTVGHLSEILKAFFRTDINGVCRSNIATNNVPWGQRN